MNERMAAVALSDAQISTESARVDRRLPAPKPDLCHLFLNELNYWYSQRGRSERIKTRAHERHYYCNVIVL